ncbi:RAMP superfamily CRISPR-associated protein [Sphaerisporangium sp. NPDC051011]|uniref:RAMP superfamily CRISPR-associated protein n=1 Tax=Sphaerisporangium sp. NPDC051011 TaxID=3155792 RepID=UPI0034101EB8
MSEAGDFTISLFMVSDWRVGTGTGIHGYADRLVQREGEDPGDVSRGPAAPVIPAKSLVGVWRDACELAAHALDGGPVGVWHDWLVFLFGGSGITGTGVLRPAALALEGPLRLPGRLPDLLRSRPRVAWAATFRKPGVAIDGHTGAAKADMLRFEEMARAGVTLEGRGRIDGFTDLDQPQRDAAVALLDAGARLLETIGGKRRRGAGRCRMTIEGVGFAPEWTPPPSNDVVPPPTALPCAVADEPATTAAATRPGWECAELVITVEQPVLAAATVLGNVVKGADHIPGWCLMPEVTRRLGGAAHALVRRGDLVVTAATPRSARGARTLPVPRVLVHRKGESRVSGNRMAGDGQLGKPYRSGYVVPEGDETHTIVMPASTVRMHNSVRDDVQRPTRDIGGVYVYRALAAGTVLHAEVRVRAGALEPGWQNGLTGRWRIGRSSKDDYGQVTVEVRPAAVRQRSGTGQGSLLRVWLLSDLLVRDLRLRPSTHVDDVRRALEQALARAGARVSLTRETERQDGRVGVALGAHRTESWHRGWGLPRPTLYGLAAGSCLTFRVDGGPIDQAVLAEVRTSGVGERRAEGFGQVELDHDLLLRPVGDDTSCAPLVRPEPAPVSGPRLMEPGEKGYEDARIFERAAWRSEIHRMCERIKGDARRRSRIIPAGVSITQVNALREITREPSPERAESRLLWLTRTRTGRPGWPPEAVGSLHGLFADPGTIWTLLGLPEEQLVVTRDGVAFLRAELRGEALRVLVDACLAAHARDEAGQAAVGGEK